VEVTHPQKRSHTLVVSRCCNKVVMLFMIAVGLLNLRSGIYAYHLKAFISLCKEIRHK
jgi:hypothetical protein